MFTVVIPARARDQLAHAVRNHPLDVAKGLQGLLADLAERPHDTGMPFGIVAPQRRMVAMGHYGVTFAIDDAKQQVTITGVEFEYYST